MRAEFTKEWVNSIPKTINSNGCWISNNKPMTSGYVHVMINYKYYVLHRLVICIYYNLKYGDNWDSRHSNRCDKACFNPKHLQPGSFSDNTKDQVRDGVHNNASKKVCPKCSGPYRIRINKTGISRGKKCRYCLVCQSIKKAEWDARDHGRI